MECTLNEKVLAAKELVKIFKPERTTVLFFAVISGLALLALIVYAFFKGPIQWDIVIALFAPCGGIGLCCSRILKMFTDCLNFLKEEIK